MTIPTAPYTPRYGSRIYGYENTASGANVLFARYASEQDEQQADAPALVSTPVGTYAVDNDQVPVPQPKSIALRGTCYSVLGDFYNDDLLEITAGPGRLWRVDHHGYRYWTPVVRTSFLALRQGKVELLTGGVPAALEFNAFTGLWYSEYKCSAGLYGYARYGRSTYGRTVGGTFQVLLGASPVAFNIGNNGSAICRALIIRLVAPAGGGITNPIVLTNTTTGHDFTISGTLPAGETFTLDTSVPSFLQNAADAWTLLTAGTNQRGHMLLVPGVNAFTLTHGGVVGAANYIEFEFHDPYY